MSLGLWKQFEGQSIDRKYQLVQLLGAGGFGGVFLADHLVNGQRIRQVAVKLFAPDAISADRQMQELIGATALDNPHLIRCFDAGQAMLNRVDLLYLVMEVASHSLGQTLAQRRLTAAEAQELLLQIVPALAFLHHRNLVHRDLKPANILRVGENWKIADFGLLRTIHPDATAHTQSLIGSAPYLPPEAFQGIVSPAWDIWSLGILLVEALAGQRPTMSDPEVTRRSTPGVPDWERSLPEPFLSIARGCLNPDRHARISTEQIEALLHRGTATPPPLLPRPVAPARPPQAAPSPRGRALPVGLLLALLLLLGALTVGWLLLRSPARQHETAASPPVQPRAPQTTPLRTPPQRAPAPTPLPSRPTVPLGSDDRAGIQDLLDRWVSSERNADLDKQVDCYAPVVAVFFRLRDVPLSQIRAEKARAFNRYPQVNRYDVHDIRFESFDGDTASVTFDKDWDASGATRFAGSERERLTLRRFDGTWRIIGEQELQVYRLVK